MAKQATPYYTGGKLTTGAVSVKFCVRNYARNRSPQKAQPAGQ
jgi:hypothetical protein